MSPKAKQKILVIMNNSKYIFIGVILTLWTQALKSYFGF